MADKTRMHSTLLSGQCLIFVIVCVLTACLEYDVIAPPVTVGFYRDDPNLMHPYADPETVGTGNLIVAAAVVPGIVLAILEYIKHTMKQEKPTNETFLKDLMFRIMIFICGGAFNVWLTGMIKICVGRLRPDFLSRCEPDYSLANFPDDIFFIGDDICTGDKHRIEEGRKSFVSGHASFAAYGMFTLIFYFYFHTNFLVTDTNRSSPCAELWVLIKPILMITCLSGWIIVAASRYTDYRHHAEDIIFGSLLGITNAFYTMNVLWTHYDNPSSRKSSKQEGNSSDTDEKNVELAPV